MNKLGNLNLIYKLFEEDREGTVFITSPGIENKSETNENNISLKYQNQLSKSVDLNIDLYKTNYLNKEQQVISNGTINTNNFDQSLNRLDIRLKHSTSTGSYYTIGFGYDNEKLERTNAAKSGKRFSVSIPIFSRENSLVGSFKTISRIPL